MLTQPLLKERTVSVSVGICATMELENTVLLTKQILGFSDPEVHLKEVVVATPNHQLAKKLADSGPRLVVLLETKREGKVAALNRIIRHSTGDILVFASADIRLSRDTVPRLVKELARNPSWGAVDARIELANGDRHLMDRVDNLLWDIHNATLDELDSKNDLGHAGDLLAVRRNLAHQFPNVINDDGFLALSVRERGFKVKRLNSGNVWITGPKSPTDYIYQRSRILRGHLELIRKFRKIPTTFEFHMVRKPRKAIDLIIKTIRSHGPSSLFPLFVAGILELVSLQVAVASCLFGRNNRPWRMVESTKRFQSRSDTELGLGRV